MYIRYLPPALLRPTDPGTNGLGTCRYLQSRWRQIIRYFGLAWHGMQGSQVQYSTASYRAARERNAIPCATPCATDDTPCITHRVLHTAYHISCSAANGDNETSKRRGVLWMSPSNSWWLASCSGSGSGSGSGSCSCADLCALCNFSFRVSILDPQV